MMQEKPSLTVGLLPRPEQRKKTLPGSQSYIEHNQQSVEGN